MRTLEICVESVTCAFVAATAGADRIELCDNLAVGGVTPSAGAIAVAARGLEIPLHVLIRPRAGDFVYSDVEFGVMRHDIEAAKALGASGVVIGILQSDGSIDQNRTEELVSLARPMSVTFHKAFDAIPNPFQALRILSTLTIDRVLTSGQAASALEGLQCLADLARKAIVTPQLMAGGQIRLKDLQPLWEAGIHEIHAGSGVMTNGRVDPVKVQAFKQGIS